MSGLGDRKWEVDIVATLLYRFCTRKDKKLKKIKKEQGRKEKKEKKEKKEIHHNLPLRRCSHWIHVQPQELVESCLENVIGALYHVLAGETMSTNVAWAHILVDSADCLPETAHSSCVMLFLKAAQAQYRRVLLLLAAAQAEIPMH